MIGNTRLTIALPKPVEQVLSRNLDVTKIDRKFVQCFQYPCFGPFSPNINYLEDLKPNHLVGIPSTLDINKVPKKDEAKMGVQKRNLIRKFLAFLMGGAYMHPLSSHPKKIVKAQEMGMVYRESADFDNYGEIHLVEPFDSGYKYF